MRHTLTASALAIIVTLPTIAHAGQKGRAPFGPPPRTAHGSGVQMAMLRWYNKINNGKCLLPRFKFMVKKINQAIGMMRRLPANERAVHQAYIKKVIAYADAEKKGVPGLGTWKEIEDKSRASIKWYEEQRPKLRKKDLKTTEEVRAYAELLKQYRQRARADRAYIAKIRTSNCAPLVAGFGKWNHFVRGSSIDSVMRDARHNQPTLWRLREARQFIKTHTGATYKRRMDAGSMLHDAVALYTNMQEELKTKSKVALIWAEANGNVEQVKKDLAEERRLLKDVAALYAKVIKTVNLPKKSRSSKAQRIARKVVGRQVRVHATSGVNRVKNPQEEIFRAQGKLWKRTWNESLEEVEIWYISREKPKKWFVSMPGVPLKKVCSLKVAAAHRYKVGLNVKLNRWLLEEDAVISPILCSAR